MNTSSLSVAASSRSFWTRNVNSPVSPGREVSGTIVTCASALAGASNSTSTRQREPHRIRTRTSIRLSSMSLVRTISRSVQSPGDGTVSAVAT